MPIYEYTCRDCNREFEALVRSDTVPACPQCHSTQVDKQLSVVGKVGASSSSASPAAMGGCGAGACGAGGGAGAGGGCAFA
jgi:putative FmdB family regulatory protein